MEGSQKDPKVQKTPITLFLVQEDLMRGKGLFYFIVFCLPHKAGAQSGKAGCLAFM